jgi:hypothetical protein
MPPCRGIHEGYCIALALALVMVRQALFAQPAAGAVGGSVSGRRPACRRHRDGHQREAGV